MPVKDEEHAAEFFKRAVVGMNGKHPRWPELVRDLKTAARLGHTEAQKAVGSFYLEGLRDADQNWVLRRSPKQAIPWLLLAAEAGDGPALFSLASCYADGNGVPVDVERAIRLYRRALQKGVHAAAWNIALVYRDAGNAPAQRRWLEKAAALGDWDARLALQELLLSSRSEAKQLRAVQELKRIARHAPDPEHRSGAVRVLTALASDG
jgi:TPR repeat protein